MCTWQTVPVIKRVTGTYAPQRTLEFQKSDNDKT